MRIPAGKHAAFCSALQEGGYAFVHWLQCSTHTTVAQYPLRELHQVLKDQIDRGLA